MWSKSWNECCFSWRTHTLGSIWIFWLTENQQKSINKIHALHAWADTAAMASPGYFYIPLWLKFRASNNLLENLATVITTWIDIIAKRLGPGDCSLSMTDSSTSEGWPRKSNFKEDGENPIQATIRLKVSRRDAKRIMENKIKNYSQWFPGWMNDVSDGLSWDDDRSENEPINFFRSFTPLQISDHFEIVPLTR